MQLEFNSNDSCVRRHKSVCLIIRCMYETTLPVTPPTQHLARQLAERSAYCDVTVTRLADRPVKCSKINLWQMGGVVGTEKFIRYPIKRLTTVTFSVSRYSIIYAPRSKKKTTSVHAIEFSLTRRPLRRKHITFRQWLACRSRHLSKFRT